MSKRPANGDVLQPEQMSEALRMVCEHQYGVVDSNFLCRPVSTLDPSEPLTVSKDALVDEVMLLLKNNRVGCVLVVDDAEKLVGIFSERDFVIKVYGTEGEHETPISKHMTPNPITVAPDETVAYALNLMSQGGFRHLPLVDDQNYPIGIVSVKDAIDQISSSFLDDLLEFEES